MKTEKVNYTSISDLIKELQELEKSLGGDAPVCYMSASPIYLNPRSYYYDGGFVLQDANDSNNYIGSRDRENNCKTKDFPSVCVDIFGKSHEDDEYLKLDGRSVREINPDSWEYLDKIEKEERKLFDGQIVKYKGTMILDPELQCYPIKAYLDSGEFGIGACMRDARESLEKKYKELKNGTL